MDTITRRYTSVDSSTGQELSFTVPVSGFSIIVEGGASYTFTGSQSGSEESGSLSGRINVSDVDVLANHVIGTVKAASGTVNVTLIGWR